MKPIEILMKEISDAINRTTCTNAEVVCALETIKLDIIFNDGLVVIDGKPLHDVGLEGEK
jgi:hypothetical protein